MHIYYSLFVSVIFTFGLSSLDGFAQQTTFAGKANYHWKGVDTLQFQYTLIIDCDDTPPDSVMLNLSGSGCTFDQSVYLEPEFAAGSINYWMCPSDTLVCEGSKSIPYGFTRWDYQGEVVVDQTCTDFFYSVSQCCGLAGDTMTLSGWFDNRSGNNPPQLPQTPGGISIYTCTNKPFYTGPFRQFYDPDGDSTVWEEIPADSTHNPFVNGTPAPDYWQPGNHGIRYSQYDRGSGALIGTHTMSVIVAERKCHLGALSFEPLTAINDTFYVTAGNTANMFFETNELQPWQKVEFYGAFIGSHLLDVFVDTIRVNDSIIARFTKPTSLSDIGTHILKVVALDNGCPYTTQLTQVYTLHVLQPTGIEIPTKPDIKVFPNPASDQVQISISELIPDLQLRVIDLSGRIVYQNNLDQITTSIDISHWASGVYTIILENKDGLPLKRTLLIKQ